jgi:hypothetical protein
MAGLTRHLSDTEQGKQWIAAKAAMTPITYFFYFYNLNLEA